MKLDQFFHENSLHDSFITETNYDPEKKTVMMRIVQLCSELSIQNDADAKLSPDDQVEIEIVIAGVEHVSNELLDLDIENYEIYGVSAGQIGQYDIVMVQLLNTGIYKEVYIRGYGTDLQVKMIGKYNFD